MSGDSRTGSDDDIVVLPEDTDVERATEPPVVARLVVEIRSDGSRTIARGALEDRATGQNVAVEARGNSPMSLALALARSMLKLPSLGRARALLPGRRKKRR
ncbi:MAG: hypothetical protein KJO07_21775 [Deltaproteobacteria bacterium]|nr:hypothetical protein [Deltaproteobacteria bacterium]